MVEQQTAELAAGEDGLKRGYIDRLGDLSMATVRWVIANPALSIAAATAVLFAARHRR
jgi:hypothetical protein